MQVAIKYTASATQRKETFDVESDMGITLEEWNSYTEEGKRIALMNAVENEQPYWQIDSFKEIS